MKKNPWYKISPKEIAEKLDTSLVGGLPEDSIADRQKKYGKNEFEAKKKATFLSRIIKELKGPLVLILLMASVATFILEAYLDMTVILIAVFINVLVGIIQEGRASQAFEKLADSQEKYATVIRGKKKMSLLTEELVPGDIVIIDAGIYVSADIRLISCIDLVMNESALTGEWVGVKKTRIL